MTSMVDEVSPALLWWAAQRIDRQHREQPCEARPWAGRCAACRPDGGCEQRAWAVAHLHTR